MTSLLIGLAISVSAPAPKDAPKTEPHVGSWSVSRLVIGGEEFQGQVGTLIFEADGKYSSLEADGKKKKTEGSVTVNTKKTPYEMDIVEEIGGKDRKSRAIFKVEGDTLTICVDLIPDEAARPTKFESPGGGQLILLILKRVKKD